MSREHVTYIWGDGALNRLRGESAQRLRDGAIYMEKYDVRMLSNHFTQFVVENLMGWSVCTVLIHVYSHKHLYCIFIS